MKKILKIDKKKQFIKAKLRNTFKLKSANVEDKEEEGKAEGEQTSRVKGEKLDAFEVKFKFITEICYIYIK